MRSTAVVAVGLVLAASQASASRTWMAMVGTVTTPTGTPVTGALIDVMPAGEGAPGVPMIAIFSTAGGRFRFPLYGPGRYRIRAVKRGFTSGTRDVDVSPAAHIVHVHVVVERRR